MNDSEKSGHLQSFPSLPGDHPLHSLPMTPEHGRTWLNCPFAADCCMLVEGLHFFIHGPLVEPHSGYLRGYLANIQNMSSARRYMEPLDALPCSGIFSAIVEWMYTQRKEALVGSPTFALYRVGKYLDMTPAFFELIYDIFIAAWKQSFEESVFLEDALDAQGVPLEVLRMLFSRAQQSMVPVQGDLLLKVLMHWSRQAQHVPPEDVPELKKMVNSELERCTTIGLNDCQKKSPETFDFLVSSSLLLQHMGSTTNNQVVSCRTCHRGFLNHKEIEASGCSQELFRHPEGRFTSNAGNNCCSACRHPVHQKGCIRYFEACEHSLEIFDGEYRLAKRAKS